MVFGFRCYFLVLAALIQWVLGLAGRRAPGTLLSSRYYGQWLPSLTGLGFKLTPSAAFEPIHSGIYRWQRGARRRSGLRQSLCCGPNPHWTRGGPDNPCAALDHQYQTTPIFHVWLAKNRQHPRKAQPRRPAIACPVRCCHVRVRA